MDDRANMPYTDAVIHEIQRFGNIAPLALPHITNKELQLEGYTVPKVSSFPLAFVTLFSPLTVFSLFKPTGSYDYSQFDLCAF